MLFKHKQVNLIVPRRNPSHPQRYHLLNGPRPPPSGHTCTIFAVGVESVPDEAHARVAARRIATNLGARAPTTPGLLALVNVCGIQLRVKIGVAMATSGGANGQHQTITVPIAV